MELISSELANQLCATHGQLTGSTLESFQEQLHQLQTIGESLCGLDDLPTDETNPNN